MSKHIPRKRFGQHFLVDRALIEDILSALAPQPGETLVEIGPGLGALTEPLLQRVEQLHVVEIDRDLIVYWQKHRDATRLVVHAGDALAFDFAALGSELRLIGNLPYNISTPLLFHLMRFSAQVRDMHFMLQKEVVDRMVAAPGDAARGRLSVMLQARYHLEWLLDVPPESFDPPPKVDSAVVRLIPRAVDARPDAPDHIFARVVTAAFSQRRKMLRNTLRGVIEAEDFASLGIDPTARAEALRVEDFAAIARLLSGRAA